MFANDVAIARMTTLRVALFRDDDLLFNMKFDAFLASCSWFSAFLSI